MGIEKLVVKEFEMEEDETIVHKKGECYAYFYDEKTGKFYRPVDGFTVVGDNLEDRFVEVETGPA